MYSCSFLKSSEIIHAVLSSQQIEIILPLFIIDFYLLLALSAILELLVWRISWKILAAKRSAFITASASGTDIFGPGLVFPEKKYPSNIYQIIKIQ